MDGARDDNNISSLAKASHWDCERRGGVGDELKCASTVYEMVVLLEFFFVKKDCGLVMSTLCDGGWEGC